MSQDVDRSHQFMIVIARMCAGAISARKTGTTAAFPPMPIPRNTRQIRLYWSVTSQQDFSKTNATPVKKNKETRIGDKWDVVSAGSVSRIREVECRVGENVQ